MAQKKRDFGLILSLGLIIVIAGYWFVKEVPMDGVEHYVDLLGDKLVTLIPKEEDKKEVAAIYDEFRTKVKEKKVSPENVEQMASRIINLSNTSDSLTRSEAEALVRIAIREMPLDTFGLVHVPDVEASPEEWKELNDRLSGVYQVEESLRDHVIVTPDGPMPRYRVDEKLNVIVDTRVRTELGKAKLKELEKQKHLFWRDSVAERMEKNLHKLEIELRDLSEDMEGAEIQYNLLKLKVLTHPIGENLIIALDSLDIVTMIDWDSLEGEVLKEIEKIEVRSGTGIVVTPKKRP
jgi:hypothetical protein